MAKSSTRVAAPAPKVVPLPERRRSAFWRGVLSRLAGIARRGRSAQVLRINPFTPAQPLPGVVGEASRRSPVPKIAMDAAEKWDDIIAADQAGGPWGDAGWVGAYAQNYYASAYAEGQVWLGYPVLALLYQRAEYRIMSETFAKDMTREWIRFRSKSDDEDKQRRIDELEDRLKELKLQATVKAAITNDGSQGRGQIYIDTGDEDDQDELRSSIGAGDDVTIAKFGRHRRAEGRIIKRLAAIEPMWCYPSRYESGDPLRADWYRPETWWVMGKEVHRTRLLTFVGNPVPDMLKPAYSFGGLSRTQLAKPYVDFWLRNRTSGSDLLNNFSVPVLKTDLSATTQEDGGEVIARATAANAMRDNQCLMLVDKDTEEYTIVSAPLGGVKDLIAQSGEHLCVPSRIPIVKFFGDQPSGMNASSEGVIRMYYDNVRADQESDIRPLITSIVNIVMIELWGEVDGDILFEFEPLWQLDEAGKAAIQKTKADTRAVDIEAGVVDSNEARLAAARDRDSQYQGLDLKEPLPEPEESDLFGPEEGETGQTTPEEGQMEGETGAAAERGAVPHPPGFRPQRRDIATSVINRAANFGGAASGGFSAHDEFREADHPRG